MVERAALKELARGASALGRSPSVEPRKRQFPRFAHEATVTLSVGGREVAGRTANLSRGGLCAMLPASLPVGSRVDVELALVLGPDVHSEPLRLSGRVVWSTALHGRHQVGLAFLPLTPDATRVLDVFLEFLREGKRLRTGRGT